ncbi:MAG: hypothetical protein PWP04_835 [Candidatus Atribacteria bacterium]|nr:hypothetical protein [Candidatus Atribacteria bacterium]
MNLGFGDRLFITIMTMFGLGFLWLGWLEQFVTIWVVPLIGLVMGILFIRPWVKQNRIEREKERQELEKMRRHGEGVKSGRPFNS